MSDAGLTLAEMISREARREIENLQAELRQERALRIQLSDDSQRHLDRALRAEAALAAAMRCS